MSQRKETPYRLLQVWGDTKYVSNIYIAWECLGAILAFDATSLPGSGVLNRVVKISRFEAEMEPVFVSLS